MHTSEDIYQIYQEDIIPLMAEMHAYVEKDYRDHYKDVSDLFKIIAENSASGDLSPESKDRAVWLITKIKIAAYSFIVKELRRKINVLLQELNKDTRG